LSRQACSFRLWRFVWQTDFEQYRWRFLDRRFGSNNSRQHKQRRRLARNGFGSRLMVFTSRQGCHHLAVAPNNIYFTRSGGLSTYSQLFTKRKKEAKKEKGLLLLLFLIKGTTLIINGTVRVIAYTLALRGSFLLAHSCSQT
jgi:hypothetical protein